MNKVEVAAGASAYSKPALTIYDSFVVRFSSRHAWRCPNDQMLAQYREHLGRRHLDVGPGTGWYLERSVNNATDLTLMDLNTNSLETTANRLARLDPIVCVKQNVLEPLPSDLGAFDSIGMNYLMHCLPGTWLQKGRAFANLAARLDGNGVLFGSTVLGDGVRHNRLGRSLMNVYNAKGIFDNRRDDAAGLEQALGESFATVEVQVIGTVAMFQAKGPRPT